MSSSSDESSSDLKRAREISRRLAERGPAAAGKPPAPVPAPAAERRFSADRVRGAAPAAPPARVTAPPPGAPRAPQPTPARLPPLPAGGGWEELLAWTRDALSAEAAFVIDDRGLLVASAGALTAPEAEAMGARLVFTLEQADAMKGEAQRTRAISLDFAGSWLTGVRLTVAGGAVLTAGVVTAKAPGPDAAAIVTRAFAAKKTAG